MNPTAQQKAAIDSDAPDILLSAGAGSGKTSTTVQRYERLITGKYTDERVSEPLEPSSILVFTFTDKAAGELRERIRKLREEGDRDFSMSSLWVGTFHSICARILRSHSVAAGVDPAFDVIDDVVANRLKESSFLTALNQTAEVEDAIQILSEFSQFNLKKGIQAAYERLRAAGEMNPQLPDPEAGRSLEEIHLDLLREGLNAKADTSLTPAPLQKATNVVEAMQAIEPADLTLEVLEAIDIFKNSSRIPDLCKKVRAAKTELLGRQIGPRYWKVLANLLFNYGNAYEKAKNGRGGLDFEDLQLRTLDLLLRRPEIADTYREQFAEIMVDEFQDTNRLQMDLIDALRGEDARLFTVGDEMQAIYGFRYADVELFRQRRAGVAFRLPADPEKRETGEREEVRFPIETLSLSANFRSQAPVIGAVNELGRQFEARIEGLRTDDEPGGAIGGTRHEFVELNVGLVPGGESEADDSGETGSRVEILLTEAGVWQETDLGPLSPKPGEDQYLRDSRGQHEAEALALAWHIRAAVDEGTDPGDIVILLRTKTRMWLFEQALKQVGLKPYVVGGTGFWETREGVDLRALLATVANPFDDEAVTGTLAGPACGLSPGALWLLTRDRGFDRPLWPRVEQLAMTGVDGIEAEDRERAATFVEAINRLRRRQAGMPLPEIVHAAVADTGYDLVNLMRDPSGSGLANIRRVAEIAGEFEAAEGRDLRGLVSWIDDSSRLDSEESIATEDEDSDVIRLMTVHKSKGLEFPMVCVADLGRQSKANSESVIWISPRIDAPGKFETGLSLPQAGGASSLGLFGWDSLRERARTDTTDEELRILHVALTRAKRRLVLSGVVPFEDIKDPTEANSHAVSLTQIHPPESLADGILIPSPSAPVEFGVEFPASHVEVTLLRPEDAEGLDRVLEPEPVIEPARSEGKPPLARPPLSAFPEVPLSYSAIASYVECPARFFARRVLKLDEPHPSGDWTDPPLDPLMDGTPPVDSTAFGVAVHELLENLPSRRWQLPEEREVRQVLESHGVTGEAELVTARSMVNGFVESELGTKARNARVEVELPLLIEIDGVMVRGFADLLVAEPETPMIIDYKSNQLEGTSIDALMEKYDLQRSLYALAVSQALGVERVETAFVFLRDPANPVVDLFDRARLDAAREVVSGLVGAIARGEYLGGAGAERQPCGECWACELLAGQIDSVRQAEAA